MRLGFVFSLPRAGSTYVQRVLSAGEGVCTVPEPWLMPALFGIRHGAAPLADFAYDHVRIGLDGVLGRLEDGDGAWRQAIAEMTRSLYGNFAPQDALFLDKTPRNAAFCGEILKTFPDARILFLWRNPLAVVASINATWGQGRWKSYFYHYDLYKGLETMIATFGQYADDRRVMAVRYEDLVTDPDAHWPGVFSHFDVPYAPGAVDAPPRMTGRMGDRSGQDKYTATSALSVDTWRGGFGNGLRRRWAYRYLDHLGATRLGVMGYDIDQLKSGIRRAGVSRLSDYAFIPLTPAYHWLEPHILRHKGARGGVSGFARR